VRHALVTGGGKGIGRAIALRLAADGHVVTITGRDAPALDAVAAEAPSSVHAIAGDVGDEASIANVLTAAVAERGPIDVLVNNAGIATSSPITKLQLDDWEHHFRINVTGVFLCTRAVLPVMLERRWGRVVTVASVASHVGWPYTAAYAASKHAVLGFMRVLAAETRDTGVTANSVCPAYVRSAMADRAAERVQSLTGRDPDEAMAAVLRSSGQSRLIEPDEVAAAVAFLASEAAGAVQGQSLIIDGGVIQH